MKVAPYANGDKSYDPSTSKRRKKWIVPLAGSSRIRLGLKRRWRARTEAAFSSGRKVITSRLAEGVGFEPTVTLLPRSISSQAVTNPI